MSSPKQRENSISKAIYYGKKKKSRFMLRKMLGVLSLLGCLFIFICKNVAKIIQLISDSYSFFLITLIKNLNNNYVKYISLVD